MLIAKDIIQGQNQRQTKTVLHKKMIKAIGKIHSNNDPETHHKNMLDLLKKFIDSLPSSQSDYFDSNSCFEGFLNWNASWKNFLQEIVINYQLKQYTLLMKVGVLKQKEIILNLKNCGEIT